MRQVYENFEITNKGTAIKCEPVDDAHTEPVQIDTGWFETKTAKKADWERVVGKIVVNGLREGLEIDDRGRERKHR
jgi:hypothetical protein